MSSHVDAQQWLPYGEFFAGTKLYIINAIKVPEELGHPQIVNDKKSNDRTPRLENEINDMIFLKMNNRMQCGIPIT